MWKIIKTEYYSQMAMKWVENPTQEEMDADYRNYSLLQALKKIVKESEDKKDA